MRSCTEVNDFFRHYLYRSSIQSKKSWEPISRAMYDFFGFLEANSLSWNEFEKCLLQKGLIEEYRDYCYDVVQLKRNTVRLRIWYICEFYKFALNEGMISTLPFGYESRQVNHPGSFPGHISGAKTVQVPDVLPKKRKDLIRYLDAYQIKQLLEQARPNIHHYLLIKFALHTGLRREEIATFPVSYVFDPTKAKVQTRNVRVTLDPQDGSGMKTKGSRARHIFLTTRFMQDLYHYITHHRGLLAYERSNQEKTLFLTQYGKPWSNSGKGIERMVSKIGAKAGVTTHPHMLRHTYATHTLIALRSTNQKAVEPLVFLKNQLGHASLRTTEVYLHIINEIADDAVLEYDNELNNPIGS